MKARALKWWVSLAVIACVALTGGDAFAQAALGLAKVGAVDPANGFPKWYLDKGVPALQLAPCLDVGPADPCGLAAAGAIPNPALPISFPDNFPAEVFYNRATVRIDGIGGGANRADASWALEGAFAGGVVAPGNQIVFARFRLRVTGLVPNATYTMTGPFGQMNFVAAGTGTINFTDNQGCLAAPPACDFTLALATHNVGPFLQWDPAVSAPPAGYIGNPLFTHAIIGSPFGVRNNVFTLKGPNVGGPGVGVVSTNLFRITGKIFVPAPTSTTLTSTPNPSTAGQAVTLTATVAPVAPATGVPDGTVTFKDGAVSLGVATLAGGTASLTVSTLAAGSHSLTAVYSGSLDFAASTSAAVTQTVNAAPAPPPGAADSVTINLAQLVRATGELRVQGVNGRIPGAGFAASVEIHDGAPALGVCPGALIGSAAVGAADGKWGFRGITNLGPTTVCVQSAGGGVASSAVVQK